ncbi:hypothetical protein RA266_27740, partial [Pseudomonas syringae pv. tagetis]|uniref:hypothetical protein n=1 Tax=Pseudomonas syringae group genomosp. 7 TaxID=251699 RepID=UPI00377062D5
MCFVGCFGFWCFLGFGVVFFLGLFGLGGVGGWCGGVVVWVWWVGVCGLFVVWVFVLVCFGFGLFVFLWSLVQVVDLFLIGL